METTKMTIHRALSELKLIDAKIDKGIAEIIPIGIYQKGKKINNHYAEDDFKDMAGSHFASVSDLIQRKVKIKSAIVKSNGLTTVKVGGKTMTVSDAITFKRIIEQKNKFLTVLKQHRDNSMANINRANEMVNSNLNTLLQNAMGKDNVKASKEDIDAISKPFLDNNTFHLFDPLNLNEKIKELEVEIGDFQAEVDAVLSESNAITLIEV
jgi:hypothetical protein